MFLVWVIFQGNGGVWSSTHWRMRVTNRMASTATSYSLSRVMDTMRSCKATLGQSQGPNTAQPQMDNSRDYKIKTWREKDVPTACWQWEPLNITQSFNAPLSCVLHAQWNKRFSSPYPCVFARKGGRRLGSYSTLLGWINLTGRCWKVTYLGWKTAEKLPQIIS